MDNWENYLDEFIEIIFMKIEKDRDLINLIRKTREYFYVLYISNIKYNIIIRKIMTQVISKLNDMSKIYNIINTTSKI